MSAYKDFAKNLFVIAFGRLGGRIITILMLPLLTRYFTTGEYAQIDIITITIQLVVPVVSLSIASGVFRYTLEENTFAQRQAILSTSLVIFLMGYVVFLLLTPLFLSFAILKLYFIYFAVIIFVNRFEYILSTFVRGEKKLVIFAASDILHTVVFAILLIVFVAVMKRGISGYLLALVFASLASVIFMMLSARLDRFIHFKAIDFRACREMMRYSLPLIPNQISWWLVNSANRYLLVYFLGYSATGLFSVANKFPTLLSFFYVVFDLAWQISAIEQYKNEKRTEFYAKIFKLFYTFVFLGVILFSIFMKPIVRIMTTPAFYDSWRYIPLLLIGVVFMMFAQFYGVIGYNATKKTAGALRTTAIAAIVNVVLCVVLIPLIGLQGAGLAVFISYLVLWFIRIVDVNQYVRIPLEYVNFILLAILTIVALFANFMTHKVFITQALMLLLFVVIQRAELMSIASKAYYFLKQKTLSH